MKNKILSILILFMFNILAYSLINTEIVPHIAPKFALWTVIIFDVILIIWIYIIWENKTNR